MEFLRIRFVTRHSTIDEGTNAAAMRQECFEVTLFYHE